MWIESIEVPSIGIRSREVPSAEIQQNQRGEQPMSDITLPEKELTKLAAVSQSNLYIYRGENLLYDVPDRINLFSYDPEFLLTLQTESDAPVSIYTEGDLVYYGILRLPDDLYCIAGPFSINKLSRKYTDDYARSHQIREIKAYHIHAFTNYQCQSLLSLLYTMITGKSPEEQASLSFHDMYSFSFLEQAQNMEAHRIQHYQFQNSEEDIMHHSYQQEQFLYDCIKGGDSDGIHQLLNLQSAAGQTTGTMSHSTRKQEEYTTVTALHLFCRAAIEGGVNPYDAYDLSDMYLQQLSADSSIETAHRIFFAALQDFVKMVQKAQHVKNQSIHTQKCRQYILRHLSKSFTLDTLAEYVGLNKTYLSALFHQIEGITLQEYILRERVGAAENMLKFSDYSISQIASYLCFQSQSYFGMIFKRYTGMTPGNYRKKNKPQGF